MNQPPNRIFIFFSLLIFVAYCLPFWILQGNSYLLLHDNLDSDFLHLKLLTESGKTFDFAKNSVIENVMNGIPRSDFRSGLNFTVWIFLRFPLLTAYFLNHIFIHFIGFFGMFLLLDKYIFYKKERNLTLILALTFGIIPAYNVYGWSVLGQPLLVWALWNIYKNEKNIHNWLIISIFPFDAFIVYVGPFLGVALVIVLFIDFKKHRKLHLPLFLATCLLMFMFVAVESQMMLSYFQHDIISHRKDYDFFKIDFKTSVLAAINILLLGYYHSGSIFYGLVLLLSAATVFLKWQKKENFRLEIQLFSAIISIAIFHGFYKFITYETHIHFLLEFNFSRFSFLLPLLYFWLFAQSLVYYSKNRKITYAAALLQLAFVLVNNPEFNENLKKLFGKTSDKPSYNQFFAQKQFQQIAEMIGQPQRNFRVVSVGIEPSVAQFNGFYTLDAYQANYPLVFKQNFSQVVDNELIKRPELQDYFQKWGNRCYVFSAELWGNCTAECGKNQRMKEIKALNIDTEALKKLGGKYIFSAVKIGNAEALHLKFEKLFVDKNSWWDVYLYKIE